MDALRKLGLFLSLRTGLPGHCRLLHDKHSLLTAPGAGSPRSGGWRGLVLGRARSLVTDFSLGRHAPKGGWGDLFNKDTNLVPGSPTGTSSPPKGPFY